MRYILTIVAIVSEREDGSGIRTLSREVTFDLSPAPVVHGSPQRVVTLLEDPALWKCLALLNVKFDAISKDITATFINNHGSLNFAMPDACFSRIKALARDWDEEAASRQQRGELIDLLSRFVYPNLGLPQTYAMWAFEHRLRKAERWLDEAKALLSSCEAQLEGINTNIFYVCTSILEELSAVPLEQARAALRDAPPAIIDQLRVAIHRDATNEDERAAWTAYLPQDKKGAKDEKGNGSIQKQLPLLETLVTLLESRRQVEESWQVHTQQVNRAASAHETLLKCLSRLKRRTSESNIPHPAIKKNRPGSPNMYI